MTRILLDNCVPKRLARSFPGHEVVHASQVGWSALSNGKLLAEAESAGFQVLLTIDRGLRFQNSLSGRSISLITLLSPSSRLEVLETMSSEIVSILATLEPGTSYNVGLAD